MELFTLDSNYQLANFVEDYASLIWTERYSTAGDFQVISYDVSQILKLLPLESTVSIRESTVPMLVESHTIKKDKNKVPVLTVKGRAFETVLERRAAVKTATPGIPGPKVPWTESSDKESNAAYQVIRQILGDGVRPPLGAQAPIFSPDDALPMIDLILPADYVVSVAKTYDIKPGQLYSTVLELINANHHGIKSVRPVQGENKIGIEIYNGADLTDTVVFDARFDQFDDATYLLSKLGSFNTGYVFSASEFLEVDKTLSNPTGLDRRVLYVDVSSESGVFDAETLNTRGLIELYKYNVTAMFDGQIAEQIADPYNKPGGYFLGDIIRLDGEYGLSQNVRIAEFIRTDDSTGSKAFPTFETIP